jgi:hypothetical protein
VWLSNAKATMQFTCGLPTGFLCLWCHGAVGVGGGLHKLVVVGGEEFGYIVGVVAVDWR